MEPSEQQPAEGESAQPKDLFDAITSTLFTGPELVEGISSALDSFTKAAVNATFKSSLGCQVKETLNVLNTYSESSVHVAVRLCQENMLQLALDNGASDKTLFEHAYPIHMCMKYQTVECARVLLRADYENLRLKDTKYQGTPLHWAKNPESIDLLLEYNADINAKSATGETPLHIMIKRNRLDCMIALVSSGADLNLRGEEGRSPLHYAVQVGNVHMVKGLLLLGAEPALRDEKGQTPLSIAHEMKEEHFHVAEIINAFELFMDTDKGSMSKIAWETLTDTGAASSDSLQQIMRRESADFNGSKDVLVNDLQLPTMSILKQKRDQEAILCLDGGGIRGIILAELLSAIENVTGQPARNLFDWISGTSTGSYLALAVAAGKSIDHCLRAYFRLKRRVFTGSRPYSAEALEDFLIEEFGEETRMDSIKHPKVVIPAVLVDRIPAALHFFRTFDAPYDEQYVMRDARFPRPKRAADQTLWASTRCSGAAPTYFRSMGRFLDGGLMANNPTLDILSEVHKYRKHGDGKSKGSMQYSSTSRSVAQTSESNCTNTRNGMGVLISLGTGRPPLEQVTGIDIFKPSSIWDTTKVIEGAKLLGELIVDQVANSDGHVVERAKSWCEMIGLPYFRLSPPLSSNIHLDEQDDKMLIQMLWETRQYIRQNYEVIMKAGKILLGLEVQM